MRKIFHAIWIIGIIWWVISTTNDLKAFKADVTAARTLSVNYEGKSIIAGDGLKSLVGKKGNIKWHSADTENSGKQDAAETEAWVTGIDSKGQTHTATFIFYTNHTVKKYLLDRVRLDGKIIDLKDGIRLLVSGSF